MEFYKKLVRMVYPNYLEVITSRAEIQNYLFMDLASDIGILPCYTWQKF